MSPSDHVYLELAKMTLSAGSEDGSVATGLSDCSTQAWFSSPESEQWEMHAHSCPLPR